MDADNHFFVQLCTLSSMRAANFTTNYLKVSKIPATPQTRNLHAMPSVGQHFGDSITEAI